MSLKKNALLIFIACIVVAVGYEKLTYEPGYCTDSQRRIDDAELIKESLEAREGEIAHYGGIDAYEKHFIRLNRHPEEAGRDFDANDPNCCNVFRGTREAKSGCGIDDYPLCVRLHFPPLKKPPDGYLHYKREGRTYLFDDCGKLKKIY